MVAPGMDNRWLEISPAGLVHLGHQLFSTPLMLLKIMLPHSLCLTNMAAIMYLMRGPGLCEDSLSKIYTLSSSMRAGDPGPPCIHFLVRGCSEQSPYFRMHWLCWLVLNQLCPCQTSALSNFGLERQKQMMGSQETKQVQPWIWFRSKRTKREVRKTCCRIEVGVPPRPLPPLLPYWKGGCLLLQRVNLPIQEMPALTGVGLGWRLQGTAGSHAPHALGLPGTRLNPCSSSLPCPTLLPPHSLLPRALPQ